jgi:predicted nucleic acid-binding protein
LRIYADSSFIVSLYTVDANSVEANHALRAAGVRPRLTTYGELEIINAMGLRVFRKEVSEEQLASSLLEFRNDLSKGLLKLHGLTDAIIERAVQLSRQTTMNVGTRAADVLHVAAAMELGADYLYTFDHHQRKLAQAVRLKLNAWP